MANDRFTKGWSPQKPHVVRGSGGIGGEINDLRNDVAKAFQSLALEMSSSSLFVDISAASPTSPALTPVEITAQLLDSPGGDPVAQEEYLQLSVFDDEHASVPSASATLAGATSGTIIAGEGTAAVKIKTDATGKVVLSVNKGSVGAVYLASAPDFLSPALSCKSLASVAFV